MDRLVAGINNDTIQRRLLQHSWLTFHTALTTCLAMETAAKIVHDLSHVAQSSNVHIILLDESSCEIATINTHRGLFQYQRLPYGISSTPGICQRTM